MSDTTVGVTISDINLLMQDLGEVRQLVKYDSLFENSQCTE